MTKNLQRLAAASLALAGAGLAAPALAQEMSCDTVILAGADRDEVYRGVIEVVRGGVTENGFARIEGEGRVFETRVTGRWDGRGAVFALDGLAVFTGYDFTGREPHALAGRIDGDPAYLTCEAGWDPSLRGGEGGTRFDPVGGALYLSVDDGLDLETRDSDDLPYPPGDVAYVKPGGRPALAPLEGAEIFPMSPGPLSDPDEVCRGLRGYWTDEPVFIDGGERFCVRTREGNQGELIAVRFAGRDAALLLVEYIMPAPRSRPIED